MSEILQQLLAYASSVWRRRWYTVSIAWVVCLGGWVLVTKLPDTYESSARIYVDADTMLSPLLKGIAVETNILQQIDIMQRTLLSRPNLEKVVRMTDLDLTVTNNQEREDLLQRLRERIALSQQGRNLFMVKYTDPNPELAKKLVQAVLTVFVESNLGASRKDMDMAQRFIDEQLSDYERQLEAAETRLAEFKKKNLGFLPGDNNYYQRLEEARTRMAEAKAIYYDAITKRDSLRKQLQEVPEEIELADGDGFGPPLGSEDTLILRIEEAQRQMESLRLRYTDKHPDVIFLQKLAQRLTEQLEARETARAEAEEDTSAGPPTKPVATMPNPVYEQLKLELANLESVVAVLERRVSEADANVEKWQGLAHIVPSVEAELSRLNRDYEIIRNNYAELRARKESAKIAEDLEVKANKIEFRIVDPPQVPVAPSGPNRPLFSSVVMIAGLGAGVAFALLLALMRTNFADVVRLGSAFSMPVLGSVSFVVSTAQRRWRAPEVAAFCLITLALFATYGGLMMFSTVGTSLASL